MEYGRRAICRWSNEEVRLVAQRTLEMQRKAPHVSLIELVRLAQRHLPEHRQRVLFAYKHIERVERAMQLLVTFPQDTRSPSPRIDKPAKAPAAGALAVTDQFAQELSKILVRMAVQELIPQLGAQVEQAVERALTKAADRRFSAMHGPNVGLATATAPGVQNKPKKTLKRVLIIGLLPDQQETIMREYAAELDLRFLKGQDGVPIQGIEASARNCDYAIGMQKFIRHSDETTAKKVAPAYLSLYGGVSGLRDVLDDIALDVGPREKQSEKYTTK